MKALKDWKKEPEGPIKLAIPNKGELSEPTKEWLSNSGIAIEKSRSYVQEFDDLTIVQARTADIPFYVASGCADFGVTGLDNLEESGFDLEVVAKLGFGNCRVCLAVPEVIELDQLKGKTIATSTPKIAAKFFSKQGIEVKIQVLSGAVEGAVAACLASAIVDLVSSGKTLVANGLKEVQTILESEAVLIGKKQQEKPSSQEEGNPILEDLVETIADRKKNPAKDSYVSKIVNQKDAIAAKITEEAGELIEAEKKEDVVWEAADLLFFMLVYLENRNIKFSQVLDELKRRR